MQFPKPLAHTYFHPLTFRLPTDPLSLSNSSGLPYAFVRSFVQYLKKSLVWPLSSSCNQNRAFASLPSLN